MTRRISILDTTLRDGSQIPGAGFCLDDKLRIALFLERLGADIIEAGFPASSSSQFRDVFAVSQNIHSSAVAAMARTLPADILSAAQALKPAKHSVIHLTISTSPVHRDRKLRLSKSQVILSAVEAVRFAKGYCERVEIGAEDATRTEYDVLFDYCSAVCEAGADIVNIPDTVGYALPDEFASRIQFLHDLIPDFKNGNRILSVHCHNDLGLATANTLAGIRAGASQAECTLTGIGERAGNAALEEVVTALLTRMNAYGDITTRIDSVLFAEGRNLMQSATGIEVSPHKPVIGRNAFSHSSGMHQRGIAADPSTYQIISPVQTGGRGMRFVLNDHSGSAGVSHVIKDLCGADPGDDCIREITAEIKDHPGPLSMTDFLKLIRSKQIITSDIWEILRCTHDHDSGGISSVTYDLKSSSGAVLRIHVHGHLPFERIIISINRHFATDLSIVAMSFGYSGNSSVRKGHFDLQVLSGGKICTCERYGDDDLLVFMQAILDIVNELTVRGEALYNETKTLCDPSGDN